MSTTALVHPEPDHNDARELSRLFDLRSEAPGGALTSRQIC
jgi:hypothetical protein